MPVSFLALARALSHSIGMLTALSAGGVIVVPVTMRFISSFAAIFSAAIAPVS